MGKEEIQALSGSLGHVSLDLKSMAFGQSTHR